MARKDITGVRFGSLVAIKPVSINNSQCVVWMCQCDCGNLHNASTRHLGRTTNSCGCVMRRKAAERMKVIGQRTKHGGEGTVEYRTFLRARERCTNKNKDSYHRYGGRGIKFAFDSFPQFLSELGRRPSPEHSLDRIDNNGNYEPGNVRWATRSEQAKNRDDKERLKSIGIVGRKNRWENHASQR